MYIKHDVNSIKTYTTMKNYFLMLVGALSFCVTLLAQSGTSSDAMATTRLALETAISDTVTGVSETAAPTDGSRDGKYLENSRLVIRKGDRRYSTEGIPVQ